MTDFRDIDILLIYLIYIYKLMISFSSSIFSHNKTCKVTEQSYNFLATQNFVPSKEGLHSVVD